MGVSYVGARYVPWFFINPDDNSHDWKEGIFYEPLTVVKDGNTFYISMIPVNSDIGRPSLNSTYWIPAGLYSDMDVEQFVDTWLDEHPEATTTVLDHSLSYEKLITGTLGFVTPQMYGAKADGVTDDTEAIQDCIDDNLLGTVYFPPGIYIISEPILTGANNDNYINVILDPKATIKASVVIDCLFYIGGKNPDDNYATAAYLGYKKIFHGGRFDATNASWAIKIANGVKDLDIAYVNIFNATNGIQYGYENDKSSDGYLHHCIIKGVNAADSVGIACNSSDCSFSDSRVYSFQTAMHIKKSTLIDNVHTLVTNVEPNYGYSNSVAFFIEYTAKLTRCYSDSEATMCVINTRQPVKIENCEYYNWTTLQTPTKMFDLRVNRPCLSIVDSLFTFKNIGASKHYGITGTVDILYGAAMSAFLLELNNNTIVGADYVRKGDLLLRSNSAPWWAGQRNTAQNRWYYVGSMACQSGIGAEIEFLFGSGDSVKIGAIFNESLPDGYSLKWYENHTGVNAALEIGFNTNAGTDYTIRDFYIRITSSTAIAGLPVNGLVKDVSGINWLTVNLSGTKDGAKQSDYIDSSFVPDHVISIPSN